MLLCGCNIVGYMLYLVEVMDVFVEEVVCIGIDVFCVFDVFNDVE